MTPLPKPDPESIASIRRQSMGAVHTAQIGLGLLGFALCFMKIYFAVGHYFFPFEHEPHMELLSVMDFYAVFLLEILSSLSFLCVAMLILPQMRWFSQKYMPLLSTIPVLTTIATLGIWISIKGFNFIEMHFVWFLVLNLIFHISSYYSEWVRVYKSIEELNEMNKTK